MTPSERAIAHRQLAGSILGGIMANPSIDIQSAFFNEEVLYIHGVAQADKIHIQDMYVDLAMSLASKLIDEMDKQYC